MASGGAQQDHHTHIEAASFPQTAGTLVMAACPVGAAATSNYVAGGDQAHRSVMFSESIRTPALAPPSLIHSPPTSGAGGSTSNGPDTAAAQVGANPFTFVARVPPPVARTLPPSPWQSQLPVSLAGLHTQQPLGLNAAAAGCTTGGVPVCGGLAMSSSSVGADADCRSVQAVAHQDQVRPPRLQVTRSTADLLQAFTRGEQLSISASLPAHHDTAGWNLQLGQVNPLSTASAVPAPADDIAVRIAAAVSHETGRQPGNQCGSFAASMPGLFSTAAVVAAGIVAVASSAPAVGMAGDGSAVQPVAVADDDAVLGPDGAAPAGMPADTYVPPGGVAGKMLHSAVPAFAGCHHGDHCKRCLSVEVMRVVLHVSVAMQRLVIPQEAALQHLRQLDDDQLFVVALAVLMAVRYCEARRAGHEVSTPHISLHATAGCGKSTVLNVIRYLLEQFGVARVESTCFSNRLLPRLYKSNHTIEALMGVAFLWESKLNYRLKEPKFFPSYDFFRQMWLDKSKLHDLCASGLDIVLFDEEWTPQPLIHEYLVQYLNEHQVMSVGAGEVLQTHPRLHSDWLARNWHKPQAFQMPYYKQLQDNNCVIFVRLGSNHRLPPTQYQMMQRMSLGETDVLDSDLEFLHRLGASFPPGTWFGTLMYTKTRSAITTTRCCSSWQVQGTSSPWRLQ